MFYQVIVFVEALTGLAYVHPVKKKDTDNFWAAIEAFIDSKTVRDCNTFVSDRCEFWPASSGTAITDNFIPIF